MSVTNLRILRHVCGTESDSHMGVGLGLHELPATPFKRPSENLPSETVRKVPEMCETWPQKAPKGMVRPVLAPEQRPNHARNSTRNSFRTVSPRTWVNSLLTPPSRMFIDKGHCEAYTAG